MRKFPPLKLSRDFVQSAIRFSDGGGSKVEMAKSDDAANLRTFSGLAYSGDSFKQPWSSTPIVVDLQGMKVSAKSRPMLKDHDLGQIAGHTTSVDVQKAIRVAGVISAANDVAREICESADNGFPWQLSMGADINKAVFVAEGEKVTVNGRTFAGPIYVVRASTLNEISFCALGADDKTSAKINPIAASAANSTVEVFTMKFEQWLAAKGFSDMALISEPQMASLRAMFDLEQKVEADKKNPPIVPPVPKDEENPTVKAVAEMRAAVAAEGKRITAIRKVCFGKHPEIEAKAIDENWDVTKTELEVLRATRTAGPAIHSREASFAPRAIEAALCLSAGIKEESVHKSYGDKVMEIASSRNLRGAGLHTVMFELIRASGQYVRPGQIDSEFIEAAFKVGSGQYMIQAEGYSTVSLPGILSNTMYKTLLAAYEAVATAWPMICGVADHKDFKATSSYRLTGSGAFEEVGPTGELKAGSVSEESYTNQVKTYGKLIGLNRQMMINDDLGAFLQIPKILGRQSAISVEKAVFTLLLANAASFFGTGNKNYISGGTTNLSITSLGTLRQKFLEQKDTNGDPILAVPKVLLVPSALDVLARQLYDETKVMVTTTADKPGFASNPFVQMFVPVSSPFLGAVQALSGASDTGWYLFADPADLAAIEVAFLRGTRAPVIESGEVSFSTLGVQWRAFFDYGVALQDFRAAAKSAGA